MPLLGQTLRRPLSPATAAGEHRLVFLLFGVLWALCLLPFLLDGQLPGAFHGDTNRMAIPERAYVSRLLAQGNFPDLCPGIFFGQPSLTYGQISLLYPTSLIGSLVPLPHHLFFLFDLWLHLALASGACTLLLRGRGHSLAAAVALGWVYANSSAVLYRSWGHFTLLHQAALLPLALLAWERLGTARGREQWRWSVTLATLGGLMLLAHNPQWLYILALLLLPLEAARLWVTRKAVSPLRRSLALGFCAVGAALLGAAVLLPVTAGFGDSFRTLLRGPEFAGRWDLAPRNLITLVFPYALFGNSPGQFRGRWTPIESVIVLGRGPMLLAAGGLLASLLQARRSLGRTLALPLWLVAGGLLLGTAPSMPWFGAFVDGLPLYGSFRAWGRASIFVVLGLSMLAAVGLDSFQASGTGLRRGILRTICGCAALMTATAGALLLILKTDPFSTVRIFLDASATSRAVVAAASVNLARALPRDLAWYAVWGAVAGWACCTRHVLPRSFRIGVPAALAAAELFFFQRFTFRDRAPLLDPESVPELSAWVRTSRAAQAPAPYTTALLAPELTNFAMHFEGVRSIGGSDVNMRASWARFFNEAQGFRPESYQLSTYLEHWTQPLVEATGVRSRVVGNLPDLAPGQRRLDRFVVTEFPTRIPYAELLGDSAPGSSVRLVSWNEDSARLEVAASGPAALRVREFPDPKWRAMLNGRRVEIEAAGPSLRIPLPAGRSELILKYVDLPARIGAAVSAAAWVALAVGAALRARKRRRAPMH